ncbi:hypothetical protein [Euzebya sp.]|uniref:hypothetical protein n=1 Tax=Euzebya sp. TaxID=1971409 RepID=UPI003510E02C
MLDATNGHRTVISAAPTVDEVFGVLPGPPPLEWGLPPRSALVLAAHPGDAAVGFGVGLHALSSAGWRITVVSQYEDVAPSDPRRWAALEDVHGHLAGPVEAVHRGRRDRPAEAELIADLRSLAIGHDLVIAPATGAGTHDDHDLLGRAVDQALERPGEQVPVYRYLMPGQRVTADWLAARRPSVPAAGVTALQRARLRLMDHLACVDGRSSAWPARTGMMTASDPVLV